MNAAAIIEGELEGIVKFDYTDGVMKIHGKVCGFTIDEIGLHGMHIHEGNIMPKLGDTSSTSCCGKGLGPHFNPFNTEHGDISDYPFNNKSGIKTKHAGDLGNIDVDQLECENCDTFCAEILKYDYLLTLVENEPTNIVGRSLVIHSGQDDLGLGGDAQSLETGNSGSRIGYGIIKLVNYI